MPALALTVQDCGPPQSPEWGMKCLRLAKAERPLSVRSEDLRSNLNDDADAPKALCRRLFVVTPPEGVPHGTGVASSPKVARVTGLDLPTRALLLLRIGAQHLNLGQRLPSGWFERIRVHRSKAVFDEDLLAFAREHEIHEQSGRVRVWPLFHNRAVQRHCGCPLGRINRNDRRAG